MQQNAERQAAFKHNAIFNPAKITASTNSPLEVQQALINSEKLFQTDYVDNGDKSNVVLRHKSDSYVISGEWVSAGIPWYTVGLTAFVSPLTALAMLGFRGLGTYTNTTNLTFKEGDLWGKHYMISFYEKDKSIKDLFSYGYRIDKYYQQDDTDKDGLTDVQENRIGTNAKSETHIGGTDTDKDGFSDRLEIELGTDWTTAQKAIALSADRATHFAVATTKTTDTGEFISAQGIELTAQMNGKTIHYTPNGNAINLGIASNEEWQMWLDAGSKIQSGGNGNDTLSGSNIAQIIYGGSGNDTLTAGLAQTILIGGSGSDTFKFNASHLTSGKMNIISDLTSIDKLDFSGSKSLFSQSSTFKWSSVLGDTSLLAKNDAALIWQDDNNTLAYKAQDSNELHTFARFDDSQTLATLQATLIV